MRINTNVSALNAYRNLSNTQSAVNSSMQKLSSGFRINRAADDAAGLGIANTMRGDIRAMSQASRNAEQANSVVQVAEGATNSIQGMLERMKELATQAGSDTVDDAGRTKIQAEYTALLDEITRTVETTKFQGTELLKTTRVDGAGDVTAVTGITGLNAVSVNGSAMAVSITTTGALENAATYTLTDNGDGSIEITGGGAGPYTGVIQGDRTVDFTINGETVTLTLGADYDSFDAAKRFDGTQTFVTDGAGAITAASEAALLAEVTTLTKDAYGAADGSDIDFSASTLADGTYQLSDNGSGVVSLLTDAGGAVFDSDGNAITGTIANGQLEIGGVVITLGADYDSTDSNLRFNAGTDAFNITAQSVAGAGERSFLVSSSGLYTTGNTGDFITLSAIDLTVDNGLAIDTLDLTTASGARDALSVLDSALATVGTVLGDIGAFQNRIENSMANLKTSIQNFTAAESVIRDVDMAEEMTKFSKNQILVQAGTAMLAQANQASQGVLQLLRG